MEKLAVVGSSVWEQTDIDPLDQYLRKDRLGHNIRFEYGDIRFSARTPIESRFFKIGKGLPNLLDSPSSIR